MWKAFNSYERVLCDVDTGIHLFIRFCIRLFLLAYNLTLVVLFVFEFVFGTPVRSDHESSLLSPIFLLESLNKWMNSKYALVFV